MNKRLFSVALALGVLASLAWTTPSRAEFITTVTLNNGTGTAVNDLDMTFAGTGNSITNLVLAAPPGTSMVETGTEVFFTFTNPLASAGGVSFSFHSPLGPVTFAGGQWSIETSNGTQFIAAVSSSRDSLAVTSTGTPVPEPSSMALGGIGLTGFFALRRFLKRDRARVRGSRAV
jgi:hypothetical protein